MYSLGVHPLFFVLFHLACGNTDAFSVGEGGYCGKLWRLCGKVVALRGIADMRLRKSPFLPYKSGSWAIDQD